MRVALIGHSSSSGMAGAELCILEEAEGLRAKGAQVFCLVPEGRGLLRAELMRRGFEVQEAPYTWWMSDERRLRDRVRRLFRNLFTLPMVVGQLQRWGCDVVYTNTAVVVSGALAARLLGLRHVWHFHEFGVEDNDLYFDLGRDFSLRWMDRLSHACVVFSRAVGAHYASGISAAKIKVVTAPVAEPAPASDGAAAFAAAQGLKCVIAGRICEKKGQQDAIRAIAGLVAAGIDAALVVAGRGAPADEEALKALCRELGVAERVRFTGWVSVSEVYALMKAADAVLVCSRCEAFGLVTVEGMYAGRPVVGTNSGGTPELIRESFNGLLYEPGDHKGLACQLRYLAEHPKERAEMGANARRWAAGRFTREKLADELWPILAGEKA